LKDIECWKQYTYVIYLFHTKTTVVSTNRHCIEQVQQRRTFAFDFE